MTKTVAYCVLIVAGALVCVLSASAPALLSDDNDFLREFVNHEFLSVLGVIVTITLASAAQLHLTFNEIEERFRRRGLHRTRAGVRQAAFWLIALFLIAVLLVVAKPLLAATAWAASLFNGAALIVLLWNVLLLISLTQTVFALEPVIPDDDDPASGVR